MKKRPPEFRTVKVRDVTYDRIRELQTQMTPKAAEPISMASVVAAAIEAYRP